MTAVLVIALAAALSAQTDRPQSVRALMETARTQMRDGNANGALESLRQARAIAPNSEEVLERPRAGLSDRTRDHAGDPDARIAGANLPHRRPVHHMLGVALMQASDLPAAVDSLRQAEKLDPARGSTILALGVALNAQNNYADARVALTRAVELEPENMDGQAALAEAEEALGELDAAERRARRVLTASKDHAAANLVLGMVRLKQGRHEEARDALLNAVMMNPTSPKAHYQLSLVYARLGDEASSEKHREVYRR